MTGLASGESLRGAAMGYVLSQPVRVVIARRVMLSREGVRCGEPDGGRLVRMVEKGPPWAMSSSNRGRRGLLPDGRSRQRGWSTQVRRARCRDG